MKYIHSSKIRRFNAIRHEKGAVGCGLSQIAILEMAISENWDNVFIAEDDLTWTEYFANGHDILEKLIRKDYDVIVLGGTFVKSYKNSFKLISCNCALSYIVNKSYYQTLLKCFKNAVKDLIKTNNQSKYAIDQAWKELQRRDNWYIIKPIMCRQLPSYSDIENVYKDYTEYFNSKILEYDYQSNLEFSKLRYENDDRFNDNRTTDWWKPKRLMPNTYFSVYDPPNIIPEIPDQVDFQRPKLNAHFSVNEQLNTTPQTAEHVDFQGPTLNTQFSVNEQLNTTPQTADELEEAKRIQQIREAEDAMRTEQSEELIFHPPKHTSFIVNESSYVRHTTSIEQPDFQSPNLNTYFTVNHDSDIRYEDPDQVVFQGSKSKRSGTLNKISVTIYQPLNQTEHTDQVAFQPPNSSTYFSVNESLATQRPIVEKVAFQTPPPTTYFSVNESLADEPPIVEQAVFQPPKDNKFFTVKETPYTKPPPTNQPIFQRQKNTPPVNKIHDTIIPPSSKLVSFRQLINLSKTN